MPATPVLLTAILEAGGIDAAMKHSPGKEGCMSAVFVQGTYDVKQASLPDDCKRDQQVQRL